MEQDLKFTYAKEIEIEKPDYDFSEFHNCIEKLVEQIRIKYVKERDELFIQGFTNLSKRKIKRHS